jgi:integrase
MVLLPLLTPRKDTTRVSEGSVFQRKDGRWVGKWKDANGKWRYLYRQSKAKAKQALREALRDRDEGIVPASKMSVGKLLDSWLDDIKDNVSARTWENREGFVRLHVKPRIGTKKLARLTADDARKLYREKLSQGMAPSSVKRIHVILNQAMREAVRLKYIRRNPLNEVKAPKQHCKELDVLSPDAVRSLLATARSSRYEAIIVLGATCGLRVGECLSLRHEDIDFDRGTLNVRRTLYCNQVYEPKTHSSRRIITLPKLALDALRRHVKGYDANNGWLFKTKHGNPIAASNFHRCGWKPMLRKAGLRESTTFHMLRHGTASLLLNQNVPIPIVSRYLGHANPGVTMKVYAHMIDGTSGMAANGIDEALR